MSAHALLPLLVFEHDFIRIRFGIFEFFCFCFMSNKLFLILSNFTRYLFSVITFFFDEKHTEAVAQRCSVRKVFLEISQNSQENTSARVSFLIKLINILIKSIFLINIKNQILAQVCLFL